MALAAASEVFGEASEVRDIVFEQMLLLDEQTPIEAVASVDAPGVVDFVLATNARTATRSMPPRLCVPPRTIPRRRVRHRRTAGGASVQRERGRVAGIVRPRGAQHGPAFSGLVTARTKETAGGTVLAEVGLPASIRSQQAALPRASRAAGCLFPVCCRRVEAGHGPVRCCRWVCAGCACTVPPAMLATATRG